MSNHSNHLDNTHFWKQEDFWENFRNFIWESSEETLWTIYKLKSETNLIILKLCSSRSLLNPQRNWHFFVWESDRNNHFATIHATATSSRSSGEENSVTSRVDDWQLSSEVKPSSTTGQSCPTISSHKKTDTVMTDEASNSQLCLVARQWMPSLTANRGQLTNITKPAKWFILKFCQTQSA